MPIRVLIIDPDAAQGRFYRDALNTSEFLLRFEASGERGLECAFDWDPQCTLLERELPGVSGLDVCRILKSDERTRHIPVCFAAVAAGPADIVAGLQAGADEYLAKPLHPTEILWRVRGLIRRFKAAEVDEKPILARGLLTLDVAEGLCTIQGKSVTLTRKEFALLETFMRRLGRVLKRRYLLETVWGFDAAVQDRTVDLTIFRLRRKLGPLGKFLETLPGFGYRLLA